MIVEINGVSADLSNTKSDDPLSQVVRVLNSHLSQLQQIDMGAARLQQKIDAAQKEGQWSGKNGHGALGSDNTESFMRSYLRR
jgi:nuclear pore complex protein Nup62